MNLSTERVIRYGASAALAAVVVAGTVYFKIRQANPNAMLSPLQPSVPGGSKATTRNTQGSVDRRKVRASARLHDVGRHAATGHAPAVDLELDHHVA